MPVLYWTNLGNNVKITVSVRYGCGFLYSNIGLKYMKIYGERTTYCICSSKYNVPNDLNLSERFPFTFISDSRQSRGRMSHKIISLFWIKTNFLSLKNAKYKIEFSYFKGGVNINVTFLPAFLWIEMKYNALNLNANRTICNYDIIFDVCHIIWE